MIRDKVIERPIEIKIPTVESDWEYYKSDLNITIPYPKYWEFQPDKKEDSESESATIIFPVNKPIQFQINQSTVNMDLTTDEYNSIVERLTESISSETDYQKLGTVDIGNNITLYNFSFTNKNKTLLGSYCVLTFPGKMCVFIAISSEKEWADMQKLMIAIIKKSRG